VSRLAPALVAAAAAALALSGCTPGAAPDPMVSASPSVSAASPLLPVYPADFTTESAQAESERVAGQIVALIEPASILNDDVHSQAVVATETAGSYWGIIHTITLDPAVDSAAQAKAIANQLQDAGWILRDTTDTDASYLAAMLSDSEASESWFVVVGADLSVPGQSVVTVQLASPDLP
jgi:hypothetical protein